ncbi:MAG: gliding motility-associated C-terminal domain-containing protein [Bacteroidota bacterium]
MIAVAPDEEDPTPDDWTNANSMCLDGMPELHNKEWIELYNPNACDSADISCYILANRNNDLYGGFCFPEGTKIPPSGFLVIGGNDANAPYLDFNLSDYHASQQNNINLSIHERWYLQNDDGWIGLYDPEGWPVEVICWGKSADGYVQCPEVEFECTGHIALLPPKDFAGTIELPTDFSDMSQGGFMRTYDGSDTWSQPDNMNSFTPGSCNSSCLELPETSFSVQPALCNSAYGSVFVDFSDTLCLDYIYSWTHLATDWNNYIDSLSAGEYILYVRSKYGDCISRYDTVIVPVYDPGITCSYYITDDECNTSAGSVYITEVLNGTVPYSISWDTPAGDTSLYVSGLRSGTYSVAITDTNGCEYSGIISVGNSCIVTAPNTFTPNGDGVNDTWVFNNLEFFPENLLEIYNRNGQLVFSAINYINDWKGCTNENKSLPEATYYYTMTLYTESGFMKGSITIIR